MGRPNPFGGDPIFHRYTRVCEACSQKWLLQEDKEFCIKLNEEFIDV